MPIDTVMHVCYNFGLLRFRFQLSSCVDLLVFLANYITHVIIMLYYYHNIGSFPIIIMVIW